MTPETSTPTTATSGLATAPAPAERVADSLRAVRFGDPPEICGSAADDTCNCRPSGRGVDWKLMTEGDTK